MALGSILAPCGAHWCLLVGLWGSPGELLPALGEYFGGVSVAFGALSDDSECFLSFSASS